MSKIRSYRDFDYEESIRLLSKACAMKYPEIETSDFYDALGIAIGRFLNPKSTNVITLVRILESSRWPAEQIEKDIFIGRYVQEYAILARIGRQRGLVGLSLTEIEAMDGLIKPVSQRDIDRIKHQRKVLRRDLSRIPCIPILDDARSSTGTLFESVRIIFTEDNPEKNIGYISSYVKIMAGEGEDDILIGKRLKAALMSPRRKAKNKD